MRENIAPVQAALLVDMDRQFGVLDLVALGEPFIEAFEEYVFVFLRKEIMSRYVALLPEATAVDRSGIQIDGQDCAVAVLTDPVRFEHLIVTLLVSSNDRRATRTRRRSIKLKEPSRYSRICIIYTAALAINFDALFELCSVVVVTAYRWLENAISDAAARHETDLVRDLYGYIRSIAPPEILDGFWFVTAADDHAFYIFDEHKVRLAMAAACEEAPRVGMRPVTLISEMLNRKIPYDVTVAREAIGTRTVIDFDPVRIKYRAAVPAYVAAIRVVNRADMVTIVPIVEDGTALLVAAIPTRFQAQLQPIIEAHQHEIARRFEAYRFGFRRVLETVGRHVRGVQAGHVGELLGGILKNFVQ